MIVPITSAPHYRDHLAPIMAHLPMGGDTALVASYPDLVTARRAGFRRFVLAQHGAGQSYSSDHPHYPGGAKCDDVGLFLAPNDHSADRWRQAYPRTSVATVGCPRLDNLPDRVPGPGPVVAVTWHWDLHLVPETMSAFAHFRDAVAALPEAFEVIGTAHPRRPEMGAYYAEHGIEYVPDFDDVCRRADVLVFDNTSAGFEFASTGRPVVVLNSPAYRRDVSHGLRFWEAADVGVQVDEPDELMPAIVRAISRDSADVAAREFALSKVYSHRAGAAERSATAIREFLQ